MQGNKFIRGVIVGSALSIGGFFIGEMASNKGEESVADSTKKVEQKSVVTKTTKNSNKIGIEKIDPNIKDGFVIDPKATITDQQLSVIKTIETMVGKELLIEGKTNSGFVAVNAEGSLTFISPTGGELLVGNMIRTADFFDYNMLINGAKASKLIDNLDSTYLTTFKADGNAKADLYVYTDITCTYCQGMHEQLSSYTSNGYNVHYIPFSRDLDPNTGNPSPVSATFANSLCESNSPEQMSALYKEYKTKVPTNSNLNKGCEKAHDYVVESLKSGINSGITGTPGIIIKKGSNTLLNVGFIPADQIDRFYDSL